MNITAILLAAGQGARLGRGPKAFLSFAGKTLLEHNLDLLTANKKIRQIILVGPREDLPRTRKIVAQYPKAHITVTAGGASRAASLAAGVKKLGHDELVVIQNVANAFATAKELDKVIQAGIKYGAAAVGRPVTSTIKRVCGRNVRETLLRRKLWAMETPQVVRADLLRAGFKIAIKEAIEVTDDIQLAELAGATPQLVLASNANHKITVLGDLPTEHHSGLGQDSHRFAETKKPLVLGGAEISKTDGLAGNSDADVILHALCNALSSAIGGGSLSTWSDKMCEKGIKDSKKYLAEILKKMHAEGWHVVNCSVTLEAGKPKLEKHLPKINCSLAKLLSIPADCVGCTVTSGEKLTSWARGEGIQVFVLVLLRR